MKLDDKVGSVYFSMQSFESFDGPPQRPEDYIRIHLNKNCEGLQKASGIKTILQSTLTLRQVLTAFTYKGKKVTCCAYCQKPFAEQGGQLLNERDSIEMQKKIDETIQEQLRAWGY